jgi:hypothetical protein
VAPSHVKRRLSTGAFLSVKGPLGEPEEKFVYPGLRETVNEGSVNGLSLYGDCARGTWREGSFTGDPEGYTKEDSGDGHLSPYSPHWGSWK